MPQEAARESKINVPNLLSDASQNITQRLVWHTALKDQIGIAQSMADGKDIQEIYGLGEAALFDEFFCFLDELGIKNLAMKLKPKTKKRETNINFLTVFLIYVMRIVSGFPHFWNIEPVLLQSQSLMRLVGFNAREIREGTSERGLHNPPKEKEKTPSPGAVAVIEKEKTPSPNTDAAVTDAGAADDDGVSRNDDKIRAPVCPQFISSFISNILGSALEKFFNADTMVILTNGNVNEPLRTYDGYDERSEIENSLFREAKRAWFIQRPPENTKNSFQAHVYLTILVMALTTAFQLWMDKQDKCERQGKETGIRKFREKSDRKTAISSSCSMMNTTLSSMLTRYLFFVEEMSSSQEA